MIRRSFDRPSTDAGDTRPDAEPCSLLVVESGGLAWGFESSKVLEILLERDGHGRALDVAELHGLPTGGGADATEDRHLVLLSMWVQPILVVGRLSILKVERSRIMAIPEEITKRSRTLVDRVAFRDGELPILLIDVFRIAAREKSEAAPGSTGSVDLGAQT